MISHNLNTAHLGRNGVNYKEFHGRKWPNEDLKLGWRQHTAGHALGILLLDDFFWPFMPGDVANATTFDFPVLRKVCLLYTSPSPRDRTRSRMPSSA